MKIKIDILFQIKEKPDLDNTKSIVPIKRKGIEIVSMGFILDSDTSATWRGPMLSGAIKQIINSSKWGNLDFLLIDMPPGTGDSYLTIFDELPVDHFILITSSNKLSISDSRRTISMLNKLEINILGYIENNILGMSNTKNDDVIPFGQSFWNSINSKTIVYDLIYNPSPTPFLKFCDKKGCMTIDGTKMLIAQGAKSLSFWTNGLEVPFEVMHDALKKYL